METLKAVKRYDYLLPVGNVEITSQGFMRVPIYATRAGVFDYKMADGTLRRELAPWDEVSKPESIATLRSCPLTRKHRTDVIDDGFLTPDNAQRVMVGYTGDEVEPVKDKYLLVVGIIFDRGTIDAVQSGSRGVSPGYTADIEMTPGVWTDPETQQQYEYDAIQRNRRYNHIATDVTPREGPEVAIKLDEGDAVQYDKDLETGSALRTQRRESMEITEKIKKGREKLRKILDDDDDAPVAKIPVNTGDPVHGEPEKMKVKLGDDGAEYEVHKDVADYMHRMHDMVGSMAEAHKTVNDAHEALKAKMDDVMKALGTKATNDDGKKDDKTTAEEKMNALIAEVEKLKKAADPAKVQELVRTRTKLDAEVKELIGEEKFTELKLDEATVLEVMKAVIKIDDEKAELDGKSHDFVLGLYDGIRKKGTIGAAAEKKNNSKEALGKKIHDAAKGAKPIGEVIEESKERIRTNSMAPLTIGMTKEKAVKMTQEGIGAK